MDFRPLLLLLLALAPPAAAQVYTPPADDGGANDNGSRSNEGGQDTVIRRDSGRENPRESILGNELPFFGSAGDQVSWNGHTWAAADNRVLAARFERYLNEPPADSEEAEAYRETIREILDVISPHHEGGPDFAAGVRLLPKASSFSGDAKLCDSLSQAIYAAVLAKKDVNMTRALNEAMEEEKDRLINKADWEASQDDDPTPPPREVGENGEDSGGGTPASDGRGSESLKYQEAMRRVAEIEALKKSNTVKNEAQLFQAKVQYQALMVQFFVQRRFQHVLMASRFHHLVFTDGDNKLHLKEGSDVSEMISKSFGTSPTVSALDSLASEAIRDVEKGVEAFLFLSERGELQSASKRLAEAYMVGEFMPAIQTLGREKKRRVLAFVRESSQLLDAISAKDYATAEELVARLDETADDFDSTKARAAIATYTRVSDMHIDSAKLAAASGDTDEAAAEIHKAMEVWPQNPKLAEFDRLRNQSGTMVRAKNDFDRLLSENNYREIFRRQYEIAPAIKDDAQREDAFEQIITNIHRIDGALEKASEFSKMGQPYAAWEQLARLRERFPDDPKLGRQLEQLAPDVADFTKALNRADELENRRDSQIGSALSWYLKARSIYPNSEMARQGIDRLVGKILPGEAPVSEGRETTPLADDYED